MSWEWWAAAAGVIAVALVVAKVVDRALAARRLELPPEALTRYRVLQRTVVAAIVALGVLTALLLIPGVRTVAGGILASSAVVGLVVGFAARSTLANFVAGLLIAFTQPLRIGDHVQVAGTAGTVASGVVEEIGLTYTVIGTVDGDRLFVPNEKLASDTIRNATIAGVERLARVSLPVPLTADLDRVLAVVVEEAEAVPESMPEKRPVAAVREFEPGASTAVVTVTAWARPPDGAEQLAAAIRLAAHRRLRAEGVYS